MMRMLSRASILAAMTAALAVPALAQDEEEGGRKVIYKQKTEIDFEGLDVSGELVKPQSALVLDRKKASFNPLIKLRENFNDEMEHSIDEVK